MIPVALALWGAARLPTMLFAGWFGPRGLATIVFALTVVEESGLAGTSTIVDVATITVLLSVILHGVSASPLTTRYAQWYAANPRETLET
jgi:NhaP-type Na+/H+ or K+/H+ antiporter